MATFSGPYGLKPLNLIGGQAFNGGVIREILLTSNNTAPIGNGDLVQIGASTAGQPTVVTATPTTSSVGIVGVCVGVRYQLAGQQLGYPLYAQYLPANAVTAGYTNIYIRVMDDPDCLFQAQSLGSITVASIGKTIALANFTGGTGSTTVNTTTGNSVIALSATVANTSALACKIVDLVNANSSFGGNYPSNPGDAYTDCIVKLNFGVHSYYQSAGTTN
tara:strand:- start:503 stop:1159 length:657 start_codon:yes stop_codon:yes gene_type:complete